MSSHALTSLLLNSANETSNSTEIVSNVTSSTASVATTLISTTSSAVTQAATTITSSTSLPSTTTPVPEDESHFLFGFVTILFFVGIALIMKIVYSNRKKYRNMAPSWRLSASRSSGNVPAGFALTRDAFASRGTTREPFGSAHYTAVPPSTHARLAQNQDAFVGNSNAQLEWERQFFEDDTSANDSVS